MGKDDKQKRKYNYQIIGQNTFKDVVYKLDLYLMIPEHIGIHIWNFPLEKVSDYLRFNFSNDLKFLSNASAP